MLRVGEKDRVIGTFAMFSDDVDSYDHCTSYRSGGGERDARVRSVGTQKRNSMKQHEVKEVESVSSAED